MPFIKIVESFEEEFSHKFEEENKEIADKPKSYAASIKPIDSL
jgi:hypothetical protein